MRRLLIRTHWSWQDHSSRVDEDVGYGFWVSWCSPTNPHSIRDPPRASHFSYCRQINRWIHVRPVQLGGTIWDAVRYQPVKRWELSGADVHATGRGHPDAVRKASLMTGKMRRLWVLRHHFRHWHPTTVFGQTIRRPGGKRAYIARSIKDQNGVLFGNEKEIHGRWRVHFKYRLKQIRITPPGTHEIHLGRNYHYYSRSLPSLHAVIDLDLKYSKPLLGRSSWADWCRRPAVMGGHQKIDKMGWSSPYIK